MRKMTDPPEKPFRPGELVQVSNKLPYDRQNVKYAGRRGVIITTRTQPLVAPTVGDIHYVKVRILPEKAKTMDWRKMGLFLNEIDNGLLFVEKCPEGDFVCHTLERVPVLDQLADIA